MQNRSAIIIFTILLALACLYSLSFSWFTSSFEAEAAEHAEYKLDSVAQMDQLSATEEDSIREYYQTQFIRQNGNEPLYPVVGLNYYDCEAQELKKGLDLEGGMSVTLEVSVPDMVRNLANNSRSSSFQEALNKAKELQKSSDDPYIDLFAQAWAEGNEPGRLVQVFHSRDTKEKFPNDLTDEQVIEILKEEAEAAVSNTEKILRTRIDKFGVTQPTIQRQQFTDRILVELPGAKDKDRVRKMLKSTANLEFWEVYNNRDLANAIFGLDTVLSKTLYPDFVMPDLGQPTRDSITVDVETGDTTILQIPDTTQAPVQLTPEEQKKAAPLTTLLRPNVFSPDGQALQLANSPVVGYASEEDLDAVLNLLRSEAAVNAMGYGDRLQFAWGSESTDDGLRPLYALKVLQRNGRPKLDGNSIVDARQDFDQVTGSVVVNMTMNSEGTKIWKAMTEEAVGNVGDDTDNQSIAIVLDSLVYSAPVVNSVIPNGSSVITMGGQDQESALREAKDLANLLKAGSLPAPANIVDEQIIGPSLGKENIDKGMMSFAIALMVILLYMIFYYRGAGVVSDIALVANMFFLLGALASIKASLTLPGIAGIILTIGMAVDANVLIFERVKEELRAGAGINAAIKKGYQKAYSAIIDANITTLLTAVILLFFGTGPIKGFATTLIIGIFTSLFAAIFLTRVIFSFRLDQKKSISFYGKATQNWFVNTAYKFIPRRKIFYAISGIIIIGGLSSLMTRGLDLGVDFAGGRTYIVEFNEEVDIETVNVALDETFVEADGKQAGNQVKKIGGTGRKVKITTNYMMSDESEDVDSRVDAQLAVALDKVGPYSTDSLESKKVAPTISDDFKTKASQAVLFSLLVIFLYIFFRFRKWQFGFGALVAMAHDVLVVLGLFSIFWGVLPFSLEIDQAFIAAILTVVGYSINDTVVVFDRIREYLNDRRGGGRKKVINDALNSTLSRTVNTSLSTFIVLFMIFMFGSDSIKGFTFALMVGVIVGTYSSLCIATPLVVDLSKDDEPKK
ncbi:MAG: protein translocase subunit SecDF [Flavobacteriales bacterium]|nr:protein translocase subunit SecDF [Flavobacteriales bacterium]